MCEHTLSYLAKKYAYMLSEVQALQKQIAEIDEKLEIYRKVILDIDPKYKFEDIKPKKKRNRLPLSSGEMCRTVLSVFQPAEKPLKTQEIIDLVKQSSKPEVAEAEWLSKSVKQALGNQRKKGVLRSSRNNRTDTWELA